MDIDDVVKKMNKEGFFKHNGYQIVSVTDENCEVKISLNNDTLNPYGMAHGAIIFGLGDIVMGLLARKIGGKAVTMDANINYLNPGKGKYLIAKANVIKNGKNVIRLSTDIKDDSGKLVATMTGTYFYLK